MAVPASGRFDGAGWSRRLSPSLGVVRSRLLIYVLTFVTLIIGYSLLRGVEWEGSAELHTLLEMMATLLAFTVGVMALSRYYARKVNELLLIGVGFFGTGLLDGYHTFVTSDLFTLELPSTMDSLIPWSWLASRVFLAVLLTLAFWLGVRERRMGSAGRVSERTVYVAVGGLTVVSFLFFAFVPLPSAYYPDLLFHRPQELLPAFFFLVALVGYLSRSDWAEDVFQHWLVIALIVSFTGQATFMSFSGQVFDGMFDAAHLLKNVSYICVEIGLIASMYELFRREQSLARRLWSARAELKEEARSKDDLVAAVSHELRTPLTVIHGYAQLLLEPEGIDTDEVIDEIARETTTLANLVEDLLTAAKANRGIQVRQERFDLLETVRGAVASGAIPVVTGASGIEAIGDAARVEQVVRNLVNNAVRHGGQTIEVVVEQHDGVAVVNVMDDGPGVPEDAVEKMFEAYWQSGFSRKKSGSIGLGLHISRHLTRLMGGDLRYLRDGERTVFEVTLPAFDAAE